MESSSNGESTASHDNELRVVEIPEPQRAHLVTEALPARDEPGTAFIRTTYTSVSPGTELLVFQGDLPSGVDAGPLDETIEALQDQEGYPYRYGYSAIGRVEHVTPSVDGTSDGEEDDEDDGEKKPEVKVGDRVFVFREHASAFSQPLCDVMLIPEELHAVPDSQLSLLPAVETAVSVLFDTHPRPGEDVGVVGQGLIGLLVTSIATFLFPLCRILAFDVSDERLKLSEACGAAAALQAKLPLAEKRMFVEAHTGRPFAGCDHTVEVSGSGAGLNGALELTADHGHVVLASWYGNKPVVVPYMGSAAFHRSHISIKASQVSTLEHVQRWDKDRRFGLVWQLLQRMQPAAHLDIPEFHPRECQAVYERLASKEIIAALFKWS